MTTATLGAGNQIVDTAAVRPRGNLEELVERLMDALFREEPATAQPSAARFIHEARRFRQAGDVDAALGVLADMDMTNAETREARWVFSEWKQLVRRRLAGRAALVYSQETGRAAALVPCVGGMLEVVAVLGMRWRPGKVVSARSLRGLRPLAGGA